MFQLKYQKLRMNNCGNFGSNPSFQPNFAASPGIVSVLAHTYLCTQFHRVY